jgi:hypothetical protein
MGTVRWKWVGETKATNKGGKIRVRWIPVALEQPARLTPLLDARTVPRSSTGV